MDEHFLKEFERFSATLTILYFSCSMKHLNEVFSLSRKLEKIQDFFIRIFDGELSENIVDKFSIIFPNHMISDFKNAIQIEEDVYLGL